MKSLYMLTYSYNIDNKFFQKRFNNDLGLDEFLFEYKYIREDEKYITFVN